MMYTSVSEIKNFNTCERQWYFSGRNGMYLRSTKPIKAFRVGNTFHDILENLYVGEDYNIKELFEKYEIEEEDQKMIEFQTEKYKELVLDHDLKRFDIIEPEMRYSLELTEDIVLFGFIDLVYKERKTGNIGILEHKFVRNFRSVIYNILDEQLKAYELAIREVYGQCNAGINLNQVRKLKTKFSHARDTFKMDDKQLTHFIGELTDSVDKMKLYKDNGVVDYKASPHWMACGFCDYNKLCAKMEGLGTNDTTVITKEDILESQLESKIKA